MRAGRPGSPLDIADHPRPGLLVVMGTVDPDRFHAQLGQPEQEACVLGGLGG